MEYKPLHIDTSDFDYISYNRLGEDIKLLATLPDAKYMALQIANNLSYRQFLGVGKRILSAVSSEYLEDKEFIENIVLNTQSGLECASDKIKSDMDFILNLIEKDGNIRDIVFNVPTEFFENKDFLIAIAKKVNDEHVLEYIIEKVDGDEKIFAEKTLEMLNGFDTLHQFDAVPELKQIAIERFCKVPYEENQIIDFMYKIEKGQGEIRNVFVGYSEDKVFYTLDEISNYTYTKTGEIPLMVIEREEKGPTCKLFYTQMTAGFADGTNVVASHKGDKFKRVEINEEIEKIETKEGPIVINDNIVCQFGYSQAILKRINNIEYFNQASKSRRNIFGVVEIWKNDIIENDRGCFYIGGLSEKERLTFYKENGFEERYEKLHKMITDREEKAREEERAKKQKEIDEKKDLESYVDSTGSLLVPVYFSNPDFSGDMNLGKIYDAYDKSTVHGRYYREEDCVQALYGVQEKGWRGYAYKGFLINVKLAKKLVRNGKLHLDVPQEDMGQIIGSRGSHINAVTESLQEKGVNVSKIILHPKSRDEMKTSLEEIKKAIDKNKSIENGD